MQLRLLYFGPQYEAQEALQIFEDAVENSNGELTMNDRSEINHETYFSWHGGETDAVLANGW